MAEDPATNGLDAALERALDAELDKLGDKTLDPEFREAFKQAAQAYAGGIVASRDKVLSKYVKIKNNIDNITESARNDARAAVADELERLKAEAAAAAEESQTQLKAKDERIAVMEHTVNDAVCKQAALAAAAKHARDPELLLPHLMEHLKMEERDGKYSAVVVNEKGEPMLEPDPNDITSPGVAVSLDDLVLSMRDRFPVAFKGTVNGSGSNTTSGDTESVGPRTVVGGNAEFLAHIEDIAAGRVRFEQG